MTALFTAPSVDEIIAKLGAQSTCDAGLTQDPWHFDTTTPSYGPGASMLDRLPANAPRQQDGSFLIPSILGEGGDR